LSRPVLIKNAGLGRNAGLRLGLALSLLSGRPVRLGSLVDDQPRPTAGLGHGVLTAVAAAASISQGYFQGELGEGELEFTPGLVEPGDYSFDMARLKPSPAPFSLLLETLLLPLSATGGASSLVLRGGSHVPGGPTSDELSKVLVPNWQALGLSLSYTEISPGFFPQGGGEAEIQIEAPGVIRHLNAQRAFEPRKVGVEVINAGLPVHLAEQALQAALERLELHGLKAEGNIRRPSGGKGQALLIWAGDGSLRVGFAALGRRGQRPDAVALDGVQGMLDFLRTETYLPPGLAARLLLTMACAKGASYFTVSSATRGLKAVAGAINAFWPNTVRWDDSERNKPVVVNVQGRNWGRGD
jgi:RNA 3'-terminal phosphate cyclase (ATP)